MHNYLFYSIAKLYFNLYCDSATYLSDGSVYYSLIAKLFPQSSAYLLKKFWNHMLDSIPLSDLALQTISD